MHLSESHKGIVGIIIVVGVFLAFLFFVGKRVYDANTDDVETDVVSETVESP